jgi:hypothetical protein
MACSNELIGIAMAKARTKGQDNAAARFGAGRAPASAGIAPIRIGTKDGNQKRAVNLGVRFTANEVEALRAAFAKHGVGRSFAQFVGVMLTDGLEGLDGGLSVLMPSIPDPTARIAALQNLVGARLESIEAADEIQAERLAVLARHQKGLAARIEATMSSVDSLTRGLGAISEQIEALSVQVGSAVRALDEVGRHKQGASTVRGAVDEYSRKLI